MHYFRGSVPVTCRRITKLTSPPEVCRSAPAGFSRRCKTRLGRRRRLWKTARHWWQYSRYLLLERLDIWNKNFHRLVSVSLGGFTCKYRRGSVSVKKLTFTCVIVVFSDLDSPQPALTLFRAERLSTNKLRHEQPQASQKKRKLLSKKTMWRGSKFVCWRINAITAIIQMNTR